MPSFASSVSKAATWYGHSSSSCACSELSSERASVRFANWTAIDELRAVVRHEAAHLAFARTHSAEESAGHVGPSEDFALAFEAGV